MLPVRAIYVDRAQNELLVQRNDARVKGNVQPEEAAVLPEEGNDALAEGNDSPEELEVAVENGVVVPAETAVLAEEASSELPNPKKSRVLTDLSKVFEPPSRKFTNSLKKVLQGRSLFLCSPPPSEVSVFQSEHVAELKPTKHFS